MAGLENAGGIVGRGVSARGGRGRPSSIVWERWDMLCERRDVLFVATRPGAANSGAFSTCFVGGVFGSSAANHTSRSAEPLSRAAPVAPGLLHNHTRRRLSRLEMGRMQRRKAVLVNVV
jgi:hypothetical protein